MISLHIAFKRFKAPGEIVLQVDRQLLRCSFAPKDQSDCAARIRAAHGPGCNAKQEQKHHDQVGTPKHADACDAPYKRLCQLFGAHFITVCIYHHVHRKAIQDEHT